MVAMKCLDSRSLTGNTTSKASKASKASEIESRDLFESHSMGVNTLKELKLTQERVSNFRRTKLSKEC